MPDWVYARHVLCGAELEWQDHKRWRIPDAEAMITKDIYCPTCKMFVDRSTVSVRGSLCAYREKAHD